MRTVREAAVAGTFYPGSPERLRTQVNAYIDEAAPEAAGVTAATDEAGSGRLRALIAPHAGYVYSGPVAGTAYAALRDSGWRPSRVAIIGPSHHSSFPGFATPGVDAFVTPLGELAVDRRCLQRLAARLPMTSAPDAHAPEHCLETQLPFLQVVLETPTIVPLLVSTIDRATVARLMLALAEEETLIVVSSDLSHYHGYREAHRIDRATVEAIRDGRAVTDEQACGCVAVNGLTRAAHLARWRVLPVDVRSSGDTEPALAARWGRVVGYGSFVVTDQPS